MRLELGKPVNCTDGPFGKLADVIIDPTKRAVTHLVVEPDATTARRDWSRSSSRAPRRARLLPSRFAVPSRRRAELEPVEETAYIRLGESPELDQGGTWVSRACWRSRTTATAPSAASATNRCLSDYDPHVSVTYDRIPKGEVEVRRASDVTSADGHHLGKVDGFLVDDDDAITHFVLERGHLWGRRE